MAIGGDQQYDRAVSCAISINAILTRSISMASVLTSTYTAPLWLPGGHLQTIYPPTCISKPTVAYRRERWNTPDGDFIDIDFVDGQPGKPMVVLFHGLEGSSDSHYCRALMAFAASLGWS